MSTGVQRGAFFVPRRLRRYEHPPLIPGALLCESVFVVLVDGLQVCLREAANGDLAEDCFNQFAMMHPGKTMLVFSQANREGNTVFETVMARG